MKDAYRHQVAGYITKPSDLDEYFLAIRMLKQLWFKIIDLSRESESRQCSRLGLNKKRMVTGLRLIKWVFICLEATPLFQFRAVFSIAPLYRSQHSSQGRLKRYRPQKKMKHLHPSGSQPYKGSARPMEILLVEDNPGDAMAVRLAVAEASETAILRVARDGEQALALIENTDFRPSLIILDLNIPRIPGLALLERWQSRQIPVVVFSSSQNDAEKAHVLALGAREFVHKPTDLDAFHHAVCGIVERWGEDRP